MSKFDEIDEFLYDEPVDTPKNNQNDSWTMEINKQKESLDWLL